MQRLIVGAKLMVSDLNNLEALITGIETKLKAIDANAKVSFRFDRTEDQNP